MSYTVPWVPSFPCHIGWWVQQLVRDNTPVIELWHTYIYRRLRVHHSVMSSRDFLYSLGLLPFKEHNLWLTDILRTYQDSWSFLLTAVSNGNLFTLFLFVFLKKKISLLIWPTHWAQSTVLIFNFKRSSVLIQWPFRRSISVSHRRIKAYTLWGVLFLFLGRFLYLCRSATGDSGNFSTQNLLTVGKKFCV